MNTDKNREPYQQAYYPPVPTRFTQYWRQSIVWQFTRFWIINYKIFKLLTKSHKKGTTSPSQAGKQTAT